MATLYGRARTKELDTPDTKSDPVEARGKLQVISESRSLAAVITNGDIIEGPVIPAGFKIIDAKMVVAGTTGAGGKFKLGYQEGVDRDGDDVAEDDDALVAEVDSGGAAAQASMGASSAGRNVIAGEGGLRTFATCFETTDDLSGSPVELAWYVTCMAP